MYLGESMVVGTEGRLCVNVEGPLIANCKRYKADNDNQDEHHQKKPRNKVSNFAEEADETIIFLYYSRLTVTWDSDNIFDVLSKNGLSQIFIIFLSPLM